MVPAAEVVQNHYGPKRGGTRVRIWSLNSRANFRVSSGNTNYDGQKIMGTLTWKRMDPGTVIFDGRPIENTVYELFSLVVPVEYRRSGVARKLCEVALEKANQDKADVYLGKELYGP